MKNLVFSRRKVLRAGGIALGLPLLETFGLGPVRGPRAAYAAGGVPRRLVIWFTANGTILNRWRPTGTETNFTLGPILEPLRDFKDKLIIIDGVDLKKQGGDAHTGGMCAGLTNTHLIPTTGVQGWAAGPSVDYVIAQKLGAPPGGLKSLELSVNERNPGTGGRMSYQGANAPIPPEGRPVNAFARVFKDFTPPTPGTPVDTTAIDRLIAQRKSVIDVVIDQYAQLVKVVSQADRERLDRHLTALREVELQISTTRAPAGPTSASCRKPDPPPATRTPRSPGIGDYPKNGQLQMDILAMALACNRTRVASLMWQEAATRMSFSFIGVDEEHHPAAHAGKTEPLTRINTWFSTQLAYLLKKLNDVVEPDGSRLLDNTVVMTWSEMANGQSHSQKNTPYLLAGSAGGYFKTGRWLKYAGEPHGNLLVSLMNAMGVEATTFGRPEWCTGPLARLRG